VQMGRSAAELIAGNSPEACAAGIASSARAAAEVLQ
jgi:hypothetical protein